MSQRCTKKRTLNGVPQRCSREQYHQKPKSHRWVCAGRCLHTQCAKEKWLMNNPPLPVTED